MGKENLQQKNASSPSRFSTRRMIFALFSGLLLILGLYSNILQVIGFHLGVTNICQVLNMCDEGNNGKEANIQTPLDSIDKQDSVAENPTLVDTPSVKVDSAIAKSVDSQQNDIIKDTVAMRAIVYDAPKGMDIENEENEEIPKGYGQLAVRLISDFGQGYVYIDSEQAGYINNVAAKNAPRIRKKLLSVGKHHVRMISLCCDDFAAERRVNIQEGKTTLCDVMWTNLFSNGCGRVVFVPAIKGKRWKVTDHGLSIGETKGSIFKSGDYRGVLYRDLPKGTYLYMAELLNTTFLDVDEHLERLMFNVCEGCLTVVRIKSTR